MHQTKDDIIEAGYIETLPLFVSIPRSGCNWFQPVLEVYFDRHRVMKHPNSPSWLEGDSNENPLWMHAHDNFHDKLDIKTNKPAIFLCRNPIDVMYSMSKLLGETPEKVAEWCTRYQRCYNKWAKEGGTSHGTSSVLVLRYEDLLWDGPGAIREVHELWKDYHDLGDFDLERAERALATVGDKKSVNAKNGPNGNFKNMNSSTRDYEIDRDRFRTKWGAHVARLIQR